MQKKISICINLSAFFGISRTERVFHIFLTISMADRREEIVNKVLYKPEKSLGTRRVFKIMNKECLDNKYIFTR